MLLDSRVQNKYMPSDDLYAIERKRMDQGGACDLRL